MAAESGKQFVSSSRLSNTTARNGTTPDLPLPRSVLIRPGVLARGGFGAIRQEDRKEEVVKDIPSSFWNVRDENVNPLPPFFPLEHSHFAVDDTPCDVIACRIADCLREESIWARFSDQKASALAETSDHVRFYVRLFRDNHDTERILVEFQRRSGCSIKFHNARRVVVRAVQGFPPETPTKSTERKLDVGSLPIDLTPKEKVAEETEDALGIAFDLMKKDRFDANILGIESLRMLSDAKCSGSQRALCVAQKIFSRENDSLGVVAALVQFRKLRQDDDDPQSGPEENRRKGIMRNHALAVLANSLSLLSQAGELGVMCCDHDWLHDGKLLSALVNDLENVEGRPHDSYQATRCLNVILRTCERIKAKSLELGVQRAAQTCKSVATCKHSMLAVESEDLIKKCGWCSKEFGIE